MEAKPLPDFGQPLELDVLLDFATIEDADIEGAIVWFDVHSSDKWIGALEAPFAEGTE